ncbi:hypothetical protein [Streptomyces sp. NPDC101181]|uniref:hypothetical protein n=1 Tax=Streptomyces sp. NPDC101181 TaxID=3366125 RepID=UPI003813C6C4
MAKPGYGKRSAPGERPRTESDFAHLLPRDAAVAAYIDRLPDGSDISVKTLARHLPYGQCALRTTLNRLQDAGHLRRGSECVITDEVMLWVTRTFFSRTAREDAWWVAWTRGDVPPDTPRRPTRSRAFILLAALGRTAPALTLSAADCAHLEPRVCAWFARGATESDLLHALTSGLPNPVHHPARLVERRLRDKLPPEPVLPSPRTVLRALECGECQVPGPPEALLGGLCRACRGRAPDTHAGPPGAVQPPGVRERMGAVRAGLAPRSERARR